MTRKDRTKQVVAFVLLMLFGLSIVIVLKNFVVAFLGAVIFYVLFKPFMRYLVDKKNWKDWVAASLIILLSFLIVVLPVLCLCFMLYSKISEIATQPELMLNGLHKLDEKLKSFTGTSLLGGNTLEGIKTKAADLIPEFLGSAFLVMAQIGIMYFLLYYLLISREKMERRVFDLMPLTPQNTQILYQELESQTFSNALSVPLLALLQGSAAWLGFWIFGLPQPFFWGMMCAFVSFLPLIGTTLIWAPAALVHMATGHLWEGIGIFIYGAVVIINIDNVFRFILQKRFAEVHPIITVFGVILGLNLFGFPGVIFGPLLISYFLILFRIYRAEYVHRPDAAL